VSQRFHVATFHMRLPLAATMTILLCARKRTHVIHQVPNVIWHLKFAEARHPCESDSVVDDPKQLLIGIALNFLTREVRCTWVHPSSRRRLGMAVNSMAYVAIQAIMCSSGFAAGFYVHWSWRYSVAARSANGKVLGLIRNARFKRAWFLQRRQPELHHSNPDQHHTRRTHCPNDSRPHQVLFRGRSQAAVFTALLCNSETEKRIQAP